MPKSKHSLTSAVTDPWKLPYPHRLQKPGEGFRRVILESGPTQVPILSGASCKPHCGEDTNITHHMSFWED